MFNFIIFEKMMTSNNKKRPPSYLPYGASNSGDDLDEVAYPHSQLIVKSSDEDDGNGVLNKNYGSEEDDEDGDEEL
jgi:hypothetical protein